MSVQENEFSCAVTIQTQENLTAKLIEYLAVNIN